MEKLKTKIQEQQESLNFEGLDLGFIYHSNAVISESGQTLSVAASRYIPTTLPGSRAPHVQLIKEGTTISTLDLFEKDFILLVGKKGQAWQKAADDLSRFLSIPLKSYRVGIDGDFIDRENLWHKKYEISETGAVLVRPDGHVGWRCKSIADNPQEILSDIMRKLCPKDLKNLCP